MNMYVQEETKITTLLSSYIFFKQRLRIDMIRDKYLIIFISLICNLPFIFWLKHYLFLSLRLEGILWQCTLLHEGYFQTHSGL